MHLTIDDGFEQFILLRDSFREVKAARQFEEVIRLGTVILAFANEKPDLRISKWAFRKDMGEAYLKLGDNASALSCFELVMEDYQLGLMKSHEWHKAGWEKSIAVLTRKIERLKKRR